MNKSELGQAAEKVMAFLDDNHYGKSVISDNRTCIARLTEYCKENGCGYSPGNCGVMVSVRIQNLRQTAESGFQDNADPHP